MKAKTLADKLAAATANPYQVVAGQIWRNCDPRMNSEAKVVSVEGAYAVIAYSFDGYGPDSSCRKVRLDRFHKCSNGFERVS